MGERIKELRKYLKLTQKEFGERIGIKPNTVATYEIGRNAPIDAVVSLICREFNVSEAWLRTGEGEMFAPTPETAIDKLVDEFNLDSLDREIISEFVKLDEKSREAVKLYIKNVARHLSLDIPVPALEAQAGPDTVGQERTEADIVAELAELKRQNQKLAAEIAAMKEEDAMMEAAAELSAWSSASAGTPSPAQKAKK